MKLAGKTAALPFLFLFILSSPLYADPSPDEEAPLEPRQSSDGEDSPLDDGFFFIEEFFLFEQALSFDESLMGGETPPSEEDPPNKETLRAEENPPNKETLRAEENPPNKETLRAEENPPNKETLRAEENPPNKETLRAEEDPPNKETLRAEENPPNKETLRAEEDPPNKETLRAEENPPNKETLRAEENPPGEETILAEEAPPSEENRPAEETFFDEYAYLFEAPPLIIEAPVFETRSFNAIFPNFSRRQRRIALGKEGLRHYFVKGESPTIVPNPDLGIDLIGSVMKKNPSHLIEALVVVPYSEKDLDLLDIYNALGRIEKIKDHPSFLDDGSFFYVFTESTRIESSRNRRAVSDPLPAVTLPFSETMYLRLKEINFGNLFIRGDVSINMYGITYSMTNFTDVRYLLLPIMKAERFITIIYLEPITEGMLIYSVTGFYLPGFIADRVNLTPNINRRIEIFINWITDGLKN